MGVIVAKWTCDKCGKQMSVIDYNYSAVDLCVRCGNPRKIPPRPPMPKIMYDTQNINNVKVGDNMLWFTRDKEIELLKLENKQLAKEYTEIQNAAINRLNRASKCMEEQNLVISNLRSANKGLLYHIKDQESWIERQEDTIRKLEEQKG